MNQEENISAEVEESNIPALTYNGRNTFYRAVGFNPKKIYKFGDKGEYTIVPESFEDFYALMKLDGIVLANDPKAQDIRGRPNVEKSINEVQRKKNIEDALAMEKSDRLAARKKYFDEKVQEKMENFGHDIAYGKAKIIPDDAKEQAIEFAEIEVDKKFGHDGILKVVLPKMAMLPGIDSV